MADKDNTASETGEKTSSMADIVGKTALSAVLATSLSAALAEPPNTKLMTLPEPTPIVQEYKEQKEEPPAPEEPFLDEDKLKRDRIKKILRALLVALFFIASLLLALGKGCTSCALATSPSDQSEDEEVQDEAHTQTLNWVSIHCYIG